MARACSDVNTGCLLPPWTPSRSTSDIAGWGRHSRHAPLQSAACSAAGRMDDIRVTTQKWVSTVPRLTGQPDVIQSRHNGKAAAQVRVSTIARLTGTRRYSRHNGKAAAQVRVSTIARLTGVPDVIHVTMARQLHTYESVPYLD